MVRSPGVSERQLIVTRKSMVCGPAADVRSPRLTATRAGARDERAGVGVGRVGQRRAVQAQAARDVSRARRNRIAEHGVERRARARRGHDDLVRDGGARDRLGAAERIEHGLRLHGGKQDVADEILAEHGGLAAARADDGVDAAGACPGEHRARRGPAPSRPSLPARCGRSRRRARPTGMSLTRMTATLSSAASSRIAAAGDIRHVGGRQIAARVGVEVDERRSRRRIEIVADEHALARERERLVAVAGVRDEKQQRFAGRARRDGDRRALQRDRHVDELGDCNGAGVRRRRSRRAADRVVDGRRARDVRARGRSDGVHACGQRGCERRASRKATTPQRAAEMRRKRRLM